MAANVDPIPLATAMHLRTKKVLEDKRRINIEGFSARYKIHQQEAQQEFDAVIQEIENCVEQGQFSVLFAPSKHLKKDAWVLLILMLRAQQFQTTKVSENSREFVISWEELCPDIS